MTPQDALDNLSSASKVLKERFGTSTIPMSDPAITPQDVEASIEVLKLYVHI